MLCLSRCLIFSCELLFYSWAVVCWSPGSAFDEALDVPSGLQHFPFDFSFLPSEVFAALHCDVLPNPGSCCSMYLIVWVIVLHNPNRSTGLQSWDPLHVWFLFTPQIEISLLGLSFIILRGLNATDRKPGAFTVHIKCFSFITKAILS